MNVRGKRGLAIAALAGALLLAAAPAMADMVETLIARSHAAEIAGKPDEAVMLLQAAMVADPARAPTYVLLGDLYARRNDPLFARKYYDEALFIEPALPKALAGSARADLALGERAAAEAKLARLEKICALDCAEAQSLRAALEAGKKAGSAPPFASLDKH